MRRKKHLLMPFILSTINDIPMQMTDTVPDVSDLTVDFVSLFILCVAEKHKAEISHNSWWMRQVSGKGFNLELCCCLFPRQPVIYS